MIMKPYFLRIFQDKIKLLLSADINSLIPKLRSGRKSISLTSMKIAEINNQLNKSLSIIAINDFKLKSASLFINQLYHIYKMQPPPPYIHDALMYACTYTYIYTYICIHKNIETLNHIK